MVFEDYYNEVFNARRSLEDPYRKVTISKEKYKNLVETAEKYEMLVKKLDQVVSKKTKLEREIPYIKDDGRNLK